jgi:protein-S-isoprenylcysteine O-methyltransferase Ste14
MRDVRWLTDREDPRTVLTVCLAILGLVALFAKPMRDQGTPAPWIVSVFGVALVQFVWAFVRYRRWRADRERDPS